MHPHLDRWFAERGWAPFAFQRDVWAAYLAGQSGLIHSATGSGKTLAAYLGPVIEWLEAHPDFEPQPRVESPVAPTAAAAPAKPPRPVTLRSLRRKPALAAKTAGQTRAARSARMASEPLTVLWITPMRALAADTLTALEKPINALGLPWSVGARTGDTSTAERARQSKRLPTVLVTTPESLSLMLASVSARDTLANIRCVIVDEWHELMGTKRGVQTELALARLRRWSPQLRVWGVSATLGNLDEAMACLLGTGTHPDGHGNNQTPMHAGVFQANNLTPMNADEAPMDADDRVESAQLREALSAGEQAEANAQSAAPNTRNALRSSAADRRSSASCSLAGEVGENQTPMNAGVFQANYQTPMNADEAPMDAEGFAAQMQGRDSSIPRWVAVHDEQHVEANTDSSPRSSASNRRSSASNRRSSASCLSASDASDQRPKRGVIVKGASDKHIVIDTLMPPEGERFPWAGHLGLVMLGEVIRAIEQSKSTLVFTNTRSQAELWYQGLLAAKPDWAGEFALHHGSLDLEVRRWVEQGLKAGSLRAVVATSSLDLGVDFSPVERVLQVGSPKGVARLLQRAGRSGHSPGQVSRVSCVPSHAFEYVESAAARIAAQAGRIESRPLIDKPLDLLTQHLVTLALGEGFRSDDLFNEVTTAWSYRDLKREEWQWALDFVTRGGTALSAYDDYRKVMERDGVYRVENATIARRHRMNIGTIVSDASVAVVLGRGIGGKKLGFVEESFAARLSPGDAFIFAGRTLEFIRLQDMVAFVKSVPPSRPTVPRWNGGRMPLSTQLAESVRELLERWLKGDVAEPEFAAVEKLLKVQRLWSRIPRRHELLFELARSREGHHLFCFPFEGRAVHTALAALFGTRIGRLRPNTFTFSVNDYGFELMSREPVNLHEALRNGLLSADHLFEDVLQSLNAAELAKRHFREIARVAGLVFQGYPGAGKSNKQLQASSGLIYDVFARFDADNPLLGQTRSEVLQRELEYSRLVTALERIRTQQVVVTRTDRPSPFAFPLMVERLYEKLSTETLAERVAKMQLMYDEAAG